MALTITHTKVDNIADWTQADLDAQIALGNYPPGTLLADIVLPSDWNDEHTLTGSIAWGEITGTLSDQTDLQSALDLKAPLADPVFTGIVQATTIQADTSAGLTLESNSGNHVLLLGAGGGANATAYGGWNFDGATADTIASFGSSKTLTSLSTATYPSLTELSYVKGVTSAIQTQIDGKQAAGNYITALTGDVTASGPGSAAATLATVNSNVGSFTNASITVNAKGLITAASSGTAPITNHNSLSGLQGGTTSEYYHLTSAEYTGTGTGVFVRKGAAALTGNVTLAGTEVITSTASSAFSVGPNGDTNPALRINNSQASANTGWEITAGAGTRTAITVISPNTHENGDVMAKNNGALRVGATGSGGTFNVRLGTTNYMTVTNSLTTIGTASVSLPTVTAGTWNGGVVGPAYGGTGVANNAAATVTSSGNFAYTRTLTGATNVTFPTTGTLATLAGSEALTNKSVNGVTLTTAGSSTNFLNAAGSYTSVSASAISGLGTGVATFLATPSSANLAAAVTDETGSGALVFATSPTLVTPNLGTPSTLVGTNITGTASGLTAGTVTTNANLTGDVTSVGNATSIAAGVIVDADINASAGIALSKLASQSAQTAVIRGSGSGVPSATAISELEVLGRYTGGNLGSVTLTAEYLRGVPISSSSTSITLTNSTHHGRVLVTTSSSPITITADGSLGNYFECTVIQGGTGQITFAASGTGVEIRNAHSYTKTLGQYAQVQLIVYDTTGGNKILLSGETAP